MTDELKAKDVVRDGDVAAHPPLWAETTNRLMARFWRRPAGSSAKLWKKVGAEDPFLPPKAERKMLEEHRQVSAAARFVRIDKAQKKKGSGLPGAKKQGRQENVPEWVKKLREQASARAAAGKAPPKIQKKGPSQVHTPSALNKAPTVRPGSKKHKNAKPPPPPPKAEPRRASKSGRMLPQRPNRTSQAAGAPGRPPLIRDHKPDTAPGKAFAELDAQETDRTPPLIRPDTGSSRRGGPIRRGVAPPGGAPPLIRPGEGRPDPRRRGRPTPAGERPKGPPGGAPPLVRDFQPETGPRDPFKERFGADRAPKRNAKRIQRGAAPPGGAPPLIRDGKPVNAPKPLMETPPTRAEASPRPAPKPPSNSGSDPFADFMSGCPSEGRARLGRSKPADDAPKRKRPVVGGPPPGGSVPLNKDADAVSSPTSAQKAPPARTPPPKKPAPARPPSDDPFGDFLSGGGPSEGRTRLKRAKPSDDAPKRKRPVVGGPPPGGSVPLNKDAAAVSSPTTASKEPPARAKPSKPAPKRPPSDDPFGDFLSGGGPSEGRTRLKRSKPADDAPKRKRPVIGGPPPGGSVPLNKDAEAVSSPTTTKKK